MQPKPHDDRTCRIGIRLIGRRTCSCRTRAAGFRIIAAAACIACAGQSLGNSDKMGSTRDTPSVPASIALAAIKIGPETLHGPAKPAPVALTGIMLLARRRPARGGGATRT